MQQNSHPTPPPRPITARAAENGLWVGLYICVLVLATGLSATVSPAAFVVWAGTIGMPFFIYRLVYKSFKAHETPLGFPELWAEGIASFFLGTLLPALLTYVALKFLVPDFISSTFATAEGVFRSIRTPEGDMWADTIAKIRSSHLPTPADVTAQLISFNIIAGTAISFFVALAIKIRASFGKSRAKNSSN